MEKNMSNSLATQFDNNSNSQSDAALQGLAALLNAMQQTRVEEKPLEQQLERLYEPSLKFGLAESITDQDILQDLLERYKDEPEIVQRLQQELLARLR